MVEKIQLEQDEHVLLQVRKHWFVIGVQLFSILIVALVPLIFYSVLLMLIPEQQFDASKYINFSVALYTAWLLICWMALFSVWTNYYLDVWTVTNKRLIAVNQRGFFFRTTASFRLERLQDIIVSVNGLIASILDYGELEIQTAGEERNFKATGIPSPGNIKSLILSSTDNLMKEKPIQNATITKEV